MATIRKKLEKQDIPANEQEDGQAITVAGMFCDGIEIEEAQ